MNRAFPILRGATFAGCLVLAGCGQLTPENGDPSMTCPDLGKTAQQYMQGTADAPVRCTPQPQQPWQPGMQPDGSPGY